MSFEVRPIFLVIRAARAVGRRPRACAPRLLWPYFLAFLALTAAPAKSASSNDVAVTKQFEVPQESDTFQRELMQQTARENTERYRVRISLPDAVFDGQQIAATSPQTEGTGDADAEMLSPSATRNFVIKLSWVFAGVIIWYLIARKLAPEVAESMTTWLRARVLLPSIPTDQLVTMLVEEKAVNEFKAALRDGVAAARIDAAPELTDATPAHGSPFSQARELVRELRRLLEEATRTNAAAARRKFLVEAVEHVQSLKNVARPAELLPLRQMSCAVEMLLKQLTEKTSNVTSSTLRTASLGAILLEDLCQPGLNADLLSEPPLRLLAVDDETFSRYTLSHSLKRGLTEPEVAENGELALALAARHTYDLIVLDVQMPGMDGFELCSKIHETTRNRETPVIFVTSSRDFDTRANSILCGGRDLIAKPFLTFELTVKALTLVARERLHGRGRLAADEVLPPDPVATVVPLPEALQVPEPQLVEPFVPVAPAVEPQPLPSTRFTAPMDFDAAFPSATAEFFARARGQIEKLRTLVEHICRTPDPRVQQEMITDLCVKVHSLTVNAEGCGQHSIAITTSALEGLLKKLLQNVKHLSEFTLQTVTGTVSLIHDLCANESSPDLATAPPIRALVVDDDPVALRATSSALQLNFSKPETACDGKSAIAIAREKVFDVIFLDVQMPDTDGFGVWAQLRETLANRDTPVVFVTSYDAAALRAMSELCGSNNFLTKPCLARELTLTALVFALRGRLENSLLARANAISQIENPSSESNPDGAVAQFN